MPPLRSRWSLTRRVLTLALAACVAAYALAVVFLLWKETSLVFVPGRGPAAAAARPSIDLARVEYAGEAGSRQLAVVVPVTARSSDDQAPWIVFFHGNGGTMTGAWPRYEQFARVGFNVLAPEYTGFGEMPGTPSEEAITADALAAYRYLRDTQGVPPGRIVLYGHSLGSCVAIDLATRVAAGALVIEGAMASVVGMAAARYPYFPVRLLMRNRFESDAKIAGVRVPLLVIHSAEDRQVPIAQGRRLFDLARAPKRFLEVPGGHQQAFKADEAAYLRGLMAFLADEAGLDRVGTSR